jgi:hypothetical protein
MGNGGISYPARNPHSNDSTITLPESTKLAIKEFLFKDKSRTGIFSLAINKWKLLLALTGRDGIEHLMAGNQPAVNRIRHV